MGVYDAVMAIMRATRPDDDAGCRLACAMYRGLCDDERTEHLAEEALEAVTDCACDCTDRRESN